MNTDTFNELKADRKEASAKIDCPLIKEYTLMDLLTSADVLEFISGYHQLNNLIASKDKVKATYPSATNRKELMAFSQDVIKAYTANQDGLDVPLTTMPVSWAQDAINKAQNGQLSHWARSYNRLFHWFYGSEYSGLEVFAEGNGKLPFWAFSALPQLTCPGLGACLNFCYSFKAFRYPDAFMRQLVNTCRLMSENGRNEIKKAFMAIPNNETVRLYVDGDIDSLETMQFWFDNCNARLDLAVYGYSKSWELFLNWHDSGKTFPANYRLNLSGGSKYEAPVFANIKARVQNLSCVRGEFISVLTDIHMPREATSKDNRKSPNWNKYQQAVMDASKKLGYDKVFVCPGKCGDCGNKHACGNPALTIPIAIAVH
jgi:hypothetical protein